MTGRKWEGLDKQTININKTSWEGFERPTLFFNWIFSFGNT